MRLFQWMMVMMALILLPATLLHAQAAPGQKVKTQSVQGTVMSIANGGFTITDKNGAPLVIYTTADTTYQLDKNNSTFAETVCVGYSIKADVTPDNSAVQVTTKTSKNTTPPTPTATPTPKPAAVDPLQVALGASDEEWQVLRPLITNIQTLQAQLGATIISLKNYQPLSLAPEEAKTELAARRAAHAKLTDQLAQARADLIKLLTMRQELVALQLGIIE